MKHLLNILGVVVAALVIAYVAILVEDPDAAREIIESLAERVGLS